MLLYIMPVHLLIVYAVAFAIRDGTWTVCGAQMDSAGVDPALCSSFGAIEATSWSLERALYRGELWGALELSFVAASRGVRVSGRPSAPVQFSWSSGAESKVLRC